MMRAIVNDWSGFWFTPAALSRLGLTRFFLGLVITVWILCFWPALELWFGDRGLLSTELAGRMIEHEQLPRWQMWSPLWWTDALWVYHLWIVAGATLSLSVALGLGGRWTIVLLLCWLIAWAHRCSWLIGVVEPAMIAFVGYLLVEPRPSLLSAFRKNEDGLQSLKSESSWQAGTVLRLLQTHWWILMAAGLASQLASFIWWRGEAVWWLAAAGRSSLLNVETLVGRPLLVNGLTHAIVLLEILALWLVLIPSTRLLGLLSGFAVCIAMALVGDQWAYAILLACPLLAFNWRSQP